jgi:hypothetical protein
MKLLRNLTFFMFSSLMALPMLASAEDVVAFTEPNAVMFSRKYRYSEEEVKKAIVSAAELNSWRVVSETPGFIQLKMQESTGGAELVIEVHYNSRKYKFKYVSSEGLQYQKASSPVVAVNNADSNIVSKNYESGATISRKYNDWLKQLTRSIKRELKNGDF